MERYLAFYPPGNFWVENAVDLSTYFDRLQDMVASGVKSGSLGKSFEAEMGQQVIAYQEGGYDLKICRDGLIMFKHQRLNWNQAFEGSPKDHDDIWRLAYRYANCISLLFHSALFKAGEKVAEVDIRSFREISNEDVSLFVYEGDRPLVESPQPYKMHHAGFARVRAGKRISTARTLLTLMADNGSTPNGWPG